MKIANLALAIVTSLPNLSLLAQQPALPPASALDLPSAPANTSTIGNEALIPGAGLASWDRAGFGGAGMAPGWVGAAARTPASQVSVLCFKNPDQKELRETTEDISVLAFLFSRNLNQDVSEDTTDYKLGAPMLLAANQAVGASYIQDFGALLKLQVGFPVAAPVDGQVERKPAQTASEWESARRELIDENSGNDYFPAAPNRAKRGAEGQPYDPTLVQTLQKRILVLLKNASNVRHLKGNEWVIVKVVGTPCFSIISQVEGEQPAGSETSEPGESKPVPHAKKSRKHPATSPELTHVVDASTQNQATVLTLRVKKSDVDAFAAGSLSEEQFIKSAEVAAYFNPAQSDTDSKRVAYEGLGR